jgi:translation initiation factor 2 subunit 1
MELNQLYDVEGAKIVEQYGSLYEGLEAASKRGVDALVEVGVSAKAAETLSEISKDKIIIKGVTIQGIIEMTSLTNEGVEDIRMMFIDADDVANKHEAAIKITTKGAPNYHIELTAEDYKKAEFAMDKTIHYIQDTWEKVDGTFSYTRE